MKFDFYELTIIVRAILSADEYLLGIKDDSDRTYSEDQLDVRSKFIYCCQMRPAIMARVRGLIAKLKHLPPKKHKKAKRKK